MRTDPARSILGVLSLTVLVAGAPCPTAAAQTDDEQIRAGVEQFEQAWNGGDLEAWSSLLCRDVRGTGDFDESLFADTRAIAGQLDLSVASLEILGDHATVIVEQRGEDADDIAYVRENGEWKWCEPF